MPGAPGQPTGHTPGGHTPGGHTPGSTPTIPGTPETPTAFSVVGTINLVARFDMTQGPLVGLEDFTGNVLLEDGCDLLLEKDPNDKPLKAIFKF